MAKDIIAEEKDEELREMAKEELAELEVKIPEMEQKIKDYGAEIERMEQMESIENALNKPVSTPLTGKPMNGADKPKTGRASDEYKAAMLNALRTNFRQISNVLSEGIDANGGYLVPEEYDSRLIDALTEENIIRKVGGSPDTRKFLENLGFVAGGPVTVISEISGNVIVNVKDSRVAVSKEMACKIMV